jgi:hypothetical protein
MQATPLFSSIGTDRGVVPLCEDKHSFRFLHEITDIIRIPVSMVNPPRHFVIREPACVIVCIHPLDKNNRG